MAPQFFTHLKITLFLAHNPASLELFVCWCRSCFQHSVNPSFSYSLSHSSLLTQHLMCIMNVCILNTMDPHSRHMANGVHFITKPFQCITSERKKKRRELIDTLNHLIYFVHGVMLIAEILFEDKAKKAIIEPKLSIQLRIENVTLKLTNIDKFSKCSRFRLALSSIQFN